MFRLSDDEEIMTLAFFVLIQYRSVTDGQTDRQTDIPPLAIPAVCIARYANALVKTAQLNVLAVDMRWSTKTGIENAGQEKIYTGYNRKRREQ